MGGKEKTIPELLAVEGLDCRGFGNIYQFVMKDPQLHIYAKAIYAFLCSYSGGGTNPYPRRETITANLMAKSSYYKYLQQLIDNGYIRLKKAHSFPFKTTYILISNPKKLQEDQRREEASNRDSRLILSGLKSRGYGSIPRIVMLDSRLTPQAKAIYAYLRSISGMGGVAFPAVSEILRHLQISKSTYNRHFKLLTACNYIECRQRRVNGRFDVTDFYIVETPDPAAACAHRVVKFRTTEKKAPCSTASAAETQRKERPAPGSQIWDTDPWDTEIWDTINNTNTNNTITTNTLSYQSGRMEGMDRAGEQTEKRSRRERCAQTQTQAIQERERYTRILRENMEADILAADPACRDYVPLIVDILVEAVTSGAAFHVINRQRIPHETVRERLLSINREHIRYVIGCMNRLTTPVKSIRRYLLTALYNAPLTEVLANNPRGESKGFGRSYDLQRFEQRELRPPTYHKKHPV